jgi:hypothetical protein
MHWQLTYSIAFAQIETFLQCVSGSALETFAVIRYFAWKNSLALKKRYSLDVADELQTEFSIISIQNIVANAIHYQIPKKYWKFFVESEKYLLIPTF